VFLRAHAAETVVVTLTVGVNDVLGTEATCLDEATLMIDLGCIQGQPPSIQANIREIVRRLRAAPGVRIIGSNYFNPLVGAWVLVPGPIGQFIAQASVVPVGVLNAAIEVAYAQESVAVADLYAAFASGNFENAVSSEWGVLPLNAANVCVRTWFCSARYPGNIHPNTDGHGVIARAFSEELAP
jgi:lysophospholipase L1-like esterase